MPLGVIDTLKPQNGQSFPVVEANDVKGGYHHVETLEQLDTIPITCKQEGMTCYVESEHVTFILIDNTWQQTDLLLRKASTSVLGGIKIGSGLSIDDNGFLSVLTPSIIVTGDNYSPQKYEIILCNSTTDQIITLPSAINALSMCIKKIGNSGILTVITSNNETIDGITSITLDVQYASISLVSDNTNWFII